MTGTDMLALTQRIPVPIATRCPVLTKGIPLPFARRCPVLTSGMLLPGIDDLRPCKGGIQELNVG
eukprot:2321186-Rhodomonas_salina.4